MDSWVIALIIRPLALLVFMVLIVVPIEYLFWKIIPEGRVKRFLFQRLY